MNDVTNCAASEPFALRVVGDDMAPEFCDGHIVIVDPGGMVSSGCYVVARHAGELYLRQLFIEADRFRLRALAGDRPELFLEGGLDDIVGVISQRAGRRRREHRRYDV